MRGVAIQATSLRSWTESSQNVVFASSLPWEAKKNYVSARKSSSELERDELKKKGGAVQVLLREIIQGCVATPETKKSSSLKID
jgi:hypothetical protein